MVTGALAAAQVTLKASTAETWIFVILAPIAVLAAIGMVLSRNAVYSALLLVVNFFCLAIFFLVLEAPFLATVQVVVYAGAIMVLFLFVLMLLGVDRNEVLHETIRGQRIAAVGLGVVLLGGVIAADASGVFDVHAAGLAAANQGGNTQAVGRLLFTHYLFAFELTGLLLVVAAVGALVLARRARR